MNFLSSTLLKQKGCVKTSSRLHKWWLTAMRGYTIEHVAQHPTRYRLGRVVYEHTWVLKAPPTH